MTAGGNTKGQEEALRLVRSGRNVFITGAGGVGKSYLIDQIRCIFPDAAITSTTAISAGNIGGVTLNSWAGLGLGLESPAKMYSKMAERKRGIIRYAQVLLIDEVSMLHPDTMDKCDELMQKVRGNGKPFGGLQVIAVGDFYQLPPVETRRGVATKYAFDCAAWRALDFVAAQLTEIIRQKDKQFQDILNAIRVGDVSDVDLSPLFDRGIREPAARKGDFTALSATNKEVDAHNRRKLSKLPGSTYTYRSVDTGAEFSVKNSRLEKKLELKPEALCLYLLNHDPLYNGSVVVVVECHEDMVVVECAETQDQFEVRPHKQEVFQGREVLDVKDMGGYWETEDGDKYMEDDVKDGKIFRPKVVASRTALPLKLGWWITVHKSQGMGLNQVHAHLARTFAPGQIYTALSRAQSLQGLTIQGLTPSKLGPSSVSPEVIEFYSNLT